MGLDKLAQVRHGRGRRVSASMTMAGGSCLVSGVSASGRRNSMMAGGSCLVSGAHGVGEPTEPTKLRGATTKVAAEAVRRRASRHHLPRGQGMSARSFYSTVSCGPVRAAVAELLWSTEAWTDTYLY